MHFFVICLLSEEPQGPVAEMLLTRVCGAYYHGGSGFCIDIAGKSMESIHFRKLSHVEASNRWAEFDAWVEDNTPVNENWNAQAAVMDTQAERKKSRRVEREKQRESAKKRRKAEIEDLAKASAYSASVNDERLAADVDLVERMVLGFKRRAEAEGGNSEDKGDEELKTEE